MMAFAFAGWRGLRLAVGAPGARDQIRSGKRFFEPLDFLTQARARTLGALDAARSRRLLDRRGRLPPGGSADGRDRAFQSVRRQPKRLGIAALSARSMRRRADG